MGVNVESDTFCWILLFCLIHSSIARPSQSIQTATTTQDPLAAILSNQNVNIRPGMLSNLKLHFLTKSHNQTQPSDIHQIALRPETTSTEEPNRAFQDKNTEKILPSGSKISINPKKNIISIDSTKRHHRTHKTVIKCFNCIIKL